MRAGSNWRHLNGLSLGMMGDPVRCLPKVVHPDVAALKLQHNPLKPEAAYFFPDDGKRTALYIFDLKDVSQIPVIVEPLFQNLHADVSLFPVMNADDVKKGMEQAS